jgi:transaldolase
MVINTIFLESADMGEIRNSVSTGLVGGIATNPDKIARSGKTGLTATRTIATLIFNPAQAFLADFETVKKRDHRR